MDLKVQFHLPHLTADARHAIDINRCVHITNSASGAYAINPSSEIFVNEDTGHAGKDKGFIGQAMVGAVVKSSLSTTSAR